MNSRRIPFCEALRPDSCSNVESRRLTEGWTVAATAPSAVEEPGRTDPDLVWRRAAVPGTVAMAVGPPGVDGHDRYDDCDWWYRCSFEEPIPLGPERVFMRFEGLATIAEVWLNGERILESAGMFEAHRVDVTDLIRSSNEIAICFRSLNALLGGKKPRPRWKTRLVSHQRLRWFRTTLLGRIPGWTPALDPVGPWRPVSVERVHDFHPLDCVLRADLIEKHGRVRFTASIEGHARDWALHAATLVVSHHRLALDIGREGGTWSLSGEMRIPEPELWWPRTHGASVLHPCTVELESSTGAERLDCGRIGFRSLDVDRSDGGVTLRVNDVPVFCRGACWTTNDVRSLVGDTGTMRETLGLLADGNANMVRVGGTMVYETDEFYSACDELGLMVWQDFMFANMDYPTDDPAFLSTATREVAQQLRRLAGHPSVVAFCGGSEVQQQAAMMGATRDTWASDFFDRVLPELVHTHASGTPYWPSTPTGGDLPFHVGVGLAHYFGVGAYRRGLEDARLAGVKFSPECLGFSNVPEERNLRRLGTGSIPPPHDPAWKAAIPRDSSAGWDFEDVRDHYLSELYREDPIDLRSRDASGYLDRSRTVTGRVMSRVFDEWQSPEHPCSGGLIWFLRDLRPGAGWGLIDSDGLPKSVYYYLKRAWAPLRITLLDRGLDGIRIEVHNETGEAVVGRVHLITFGRTSNVLADVTTAVRVAARSVWSESAEALLGRFSDPSYAYRFGPLGHTAVAARLELENEEQPSSSARSQAAVYWPALHESLAPVRVDGVVDLARGVGTVRSEGLARDVHLDAPGVVDDNYFDLVPDEERIFRMSGSIDERGGAHVRAENAPHWSRLRS